MSNQAMQKELSRVRSLKRASEAEVELLRSDMEQGKIHLRVNHDKEFRDRAVEALLKINQPSWSWGFQGGYYADPVEGVVFFKGSSALWNPWGDDVDWRIVPVEDLFNQDGNDFDPSVDWDSDNYPISKSEILRCYLVYEEEEFEEDGSLPPWASESDVFWEDALIWARECEESPRKYVHWDDNAIRSLSELISEVERESWDIAQSFALGEILDEVIIDLNN